jgi:methyl-accepting chemotaxis protein
MFMEKARDGDLKQELHFRSADHFKELAQGYNEMLDGIRASLAKKMSASASAAAQIERALTHVNDPAVRQELESALREIRSADGA